MRSGDDPDDRTWNRRPKAEARSWNDSLNRTDWQHYKEPRQWVPTLIATATIVGAIQFYRSYLRRIPGTAHIRPGLFYKRSLLGRVTSVGDGDNFHMFHTPGGRLAGWGWLRSVPTDRKVLKGRTIPIRIAGIDAPEGAHFGRPGQPFSGEALAFLRSYLQGRNVRARIYRRDQYERVVATVFVRQWLVVRRDVGYEMLKRGLATTYEAKTGVEFGGLEAKYRAAEALAKQKRLGMWSGKKGSVVETPREYKNRYALAEKETTKR
ncbi:hypothetical protein MAPG_06378 [Magnaporthiopsis poae ATCC 64411]|uniref:Probable endonuclease LCL3 n=1 Tax=Magnaporthiopsis poae (strain ATCC 64411 / 73-15) TaxID=644358 RepID=A0A0C4E1V6_MAGP6|nr:hypothetical protein MAPG_06378 [Magnaporthiopsis poae ATCC 64411]